MLREVADHGHHPLVPFGVYVKVWAILMTLTTLTVAVSYVDMKHVTVLAACMIAVAKSLLVVLYFMHVRFEQRIYAFMILAVLGTYGVFIGLTFVDYWYR